MQKYKKNILRKLVMIALIFKEMIAWSSTTQNIELEVGQIKNIQIDSDETIKVKGNSIHVYQVSSNIYQIIALNKGISVVDPTPTSREQHPFIISVGVAKKSNDSCLSYGLKCADNLLSGQVRDISQLYFINAILDKDWVDISAGTLTNQERPLTLLSSPVHSINKMPGKILVIKGSFTESERKSLEKSLSNLSLTFLEESRLTKKIRVYFEISESSSLEINDVHLSKKSVFPDLWSYGSDSGRTILASTSKIFSLTESEKFEFSESFRPKESDTFRFSGSGTISLEDASAEVEYQVEVLVGTETSQVKSSLKSSYDTPILLSDSTAHMNGGLKELTMPWAKIPILGPLFKTMFNSSYHTQCRIWLEIINAKES